MRINIGPYRSDIIPVRNWERRYEMWRFNKYYLDENDYTWYDKIVMGFFDKFSDLVLPLNRWANNRKRKVKIHIDGYDVWSADYTLAQIIHPVLVKLKGCKQGSPNIDNEDVPDRLKSTSAGPKENEWDTDEFYHARWDYVLDEMIWAFKQHADPYDGDNEFHHNPEQLEMTFASLEDNPNLSTMGFNYQKDPTKPAYWVDCEGKKNHHERMNNGVRLFAKYYQCLWD